jgi:hypothetical protein
MSKIVGIERLDTTIQPVSGNGDNWNMTWADNDKQYIGLCDGKGWDHLPEYTDESYNTRIFIINGNAPDYSFEFMPNFPDLLSHYPPTAERPRDFSRYYGFGIIVLDDTLYQFMSTPKEPFGAPNNAFIGAKLIYSPDKGKTWKNQDGTPLRWEPWEERNSKNMQFYYEPDESFSLLTVLQMGKNYADNTDGYIYIYAPNGSVDGKMNQLVMLRVQKDQLLNRAAYEYFVSVNTDGSSNWSPDINQRGIVYTFPAGWVNWAIGHNFGGHPYAWHPSVVYNKALGVYMMFNWGIGVGENGDWFEKPSYLGFWTAPQPWGPWTQVHKDTAWTPNGDQNARCYQPQIAPKWIAEDGKSFWMVWTDFRLVNGNRPYYAFNCQKVNILTG